MLPTERELRDLVGAQPQHHARGRFRHWATNRSPNTTADRRATCHPLCHRSAAVPWPEACGTNITWHHRIQLLQRITRFAEPKVALVNVPEPRLPPHRSPPRKSMPAVNQKITNPRRFFEVSNLPSKLARPTSAASDGAERRTHTTSRYCASARWPQPNRPTRLCADGPPMATKRAQAAHGRLNLGTTMMAAWRCFHPRTPLLATLPRLDTAPITIRGSDGPGPAVVHALSRPGLGNKVPAQDDLAVSGALTQAPRGRKSVCASR